MTDKQKTIVAYYLAVNIFMVIAIVVRFFFVRNNGHYKGKPLVGIFFFDYSDITDYKCLNIPVLGFIILNVFAVIFKTTLVIEKYL